MTRRRIVDHAATTVLATACVVFCGAARAGEDAPARVPRTVPQWQVVEIVLSGCAGYTYGAAGVWALKWEPADTRWSNYNHSIDGWYAGMALPGSHQMAVLAEFFRSLSWQSLTPRFSDPAWSQFTDREQSVLSTCGRDQYVAYFYGTSPSPGTLRNLDPVCSYRADWFDPRTGAFAAIATGIRATSGQWSIPAKPDGDWVLVVRTQAEGESFGF